MLRAMAIVLGLVGAIALLFAPGVSASHAHGPPPRLPGASDLSNHTIYPTRSMGYAELRARYQGLGWIRIGHTRDFK